jgi:hypothetical protein
MLEAVEREGYPAKPGTNRTAARSSPFFLGTKEFRYFDVTELGI